MKCRRTRNFRRYRLNPSGADIMTASIAPLLPYAVVGVVLYFYGGRIANLLGAKIAGVDTEQFKEDVKTVTSAVKSPVSTAKDLFQYVTGQQTYMSPEEAKVQAAKILAEKQSTVKPISALPVNDIVIKAADTVKAGAVTIATSTGSEISTALKTGFLSLFGYQTPETKYMTQEEARAEAARIKAAKGF